MTEIKVSCADIFLRPRYVSPTKDCIKKMDRPHSFKTREDTFETQQETHKTMKGRMQ